MTETLRLNVAIPQGTCCVCTMKPVAERLDMTIAIAGVRHEVTICRRCLGEHSPRVLVELENA